VTEYLFFQEFWHVFFDVLWAFIPLVIFFGLFQAVYLKLPLRYVLNVLKGVLITFAGVVLFLQGVNMAFLPAGRDIGAALGSLEEVWILIPFGFLLGFLATYAEPAVRVLCHQIEQSSSGSISGALILYALSSGVAVSVAVGMARIVYGFPFIYIIIPGYILTIILLWFADADFIAIAFDSGGVATGPMAVTFLMSMAVGAAAVIEGRSPVTDGFGLIALIALAPILAIMLLGIMYRRRELSNSQLPPPEVRGLHRESHGD